MTAIEAQSDAAPSRQAEQAPPSMTIVIVCYRAADLTMDCLRSIAPQAADLPGVRVVVCENGTSDAAARELEAFVAEQQWRDWVEIRPIMPNRGFSGGNNSVLRAELATGDPSDYFLLLNADTIMRPGALASLLEAAEARPDVGIVSPRLEWPDGEGQPSCFRDWRPSDEFLIAARTGVFSKLFGRSGIALPVLDAPTEVDWTSFACALIRWDVLQEVGVLDDGFFLYYDDPDYCRRARQAGWKVLHWPAARVVHLRGRSNPVKEMTAQLKRRPAYWYESRARYYAKYYGRLGLWAANVLWHLGRVISWTRERIGGKQRHICEQEWRDIWSNCWTPLRAPHLDREDAR